LSQWIFVVLFLIFISYNISVKRMQVHPDLNRSDPSSKDKFLRLRDAYTVLSSSQLRHDYDQQLQKTRRPTASYSSRFTGTFTPPKKSQYRFVIIVAFMLYRVYLPSML